MSTHGPQHDNFTAQAGMPHGGNLADEGYRPASASTSHGKLFDQFAVRPGVERYGERWDEFPQTWHEMPVLHGEHYDEGFKAPLALTNTDGHGTWFDVFRGGAHIRYVADGADYEGTVIDCNGEFATVISREGKQHEVLITNVLAYATHQGQPSKPAGREAHPGYTDDLGIPRSKAHAPSAHDAKASGGHLALVKTDTLGDLEIDVTKARTGAHKPISSDTVMRHRNNLAILKNPHNTTPLSCPGCGKSDKYNVGHTALKGPKMGTSKMYGTCTRKSCGFKHTFSPPKTKSVFGKILEETDELVVSKVQGDDHDEVLDVIKGGAGGPTAAYNHGGKVYCPGCKPSGAAKLPKAKHERAHGMKCGGSCGRSFGQGGSSTQSYSTWLNPVTKSVDSSETAVQEKDEPGGGGKKPYCKACRHVCRDVAQGGTCPTCGGKVTYKTHDDHLVDVAKQLREDAGVAR